MDRIKNRLSDLLKSKELLRYVIAGVFTTVVNVFVFSVLRFAIGLSLNASNAIAILTSIVFAFFINKFYTFRSQHNDFVYVATEFLKFVGGRLITMAIEIGGVYVLAIWFGLPDLAAKLLTQAVVVVSNYVISKFVVFNKNESATVADWAKENWIYILSFVIPAVLFIISCIKYKVTPFGDQTLMIIDSLHQYLPFFSEYYDKLTKSGEFLYSWNGAMGYNFLTLWAYYLSSPFNLLILLFPKIYINTAMTLIIGLKITLCSVTMTYAVCKMFKRKDIYAVMVGICYAFSNYVIGYYWNIMWLDVLLLTPLVVLGLQRLIEEKDSRLYIVTLFMSMFCNFYIAFMLCIFLVLWFLIYSHKSFKEFLNSGVRFALSSLLAAGMAMCILIPTYTGIMLTGPAHSDFPEWDWYNFIVDILKQFAMYSGSITNQSDDGGVNLYCGVLTIVLVVMYFLLKEVSIWQKLKRLALLVFFIASFNITTLNYIWHGFHDQFGIPNRFSFLMIFVLLLMAYETLINIKSFSIFAYAAPAALLGALIIYDSEMEPLFSDDNVIKYTMIFFIIYLLIFSLRMILEWKEKTMAFILLGVLAIELGMNTIYNFDGNGQITISDYFSDSESMWAAKEAVDDGTFYREELSKNKIVDENFWLNLKSVGVFGSTANGDAVTLLGRMGFYVSANEHLYNGATPLTDSLFGVKYLYKRDGEYFDHGFDFFKEIEGIEIYKNPYALSLGYMVENGIKDWEYDQYEPADNLNDFVKSGAGIDKDLFTELPDDFSGSGENCEVTWNGTGDGTYSYSRTGDGDLSVTLTLTVKDDKPVYVKSTGTDLSALRICVNGEEKCNGRYFFQLVPVGDTKAGDQVTVQYMFNGSEADDQTVNMQAYSFNQDVFDRIYNNLSDEQWDITSYTSNTIEGTIDAKKDGVMMTTIVNEPGFKVWVDKEETKIQEIGDSFIGIPLSKGKHKIEVRFVPQSLPWAFLVTIASVVIFVLYLIFRERIGRKGDDTQKAS